MPILLDVESRSRADLPTVGGRLYWEHPSTEVLCVVWCDTDTGHAAVWHVGYDDPYFAEGGEVFAAHNARGFDRFAIEKLGWRCAEWVDTSELARMAGMPGKLDALGTRLLGLPKDKVASKFTKGLSTCRRPTRAPYRIEADVWSTFTPDERREYGVQAELTPAVIARVDAYCASDVEIIAAGWPLLEEWQTLEPEVRRVDHVVNDRGIGFDRELAQRLLEEDARNGDAALHEIAHGLGMPAALVRDVASSPQQFTEATGLGDAQKETVENAILDTGTPAYVVALCRARQALASIARGKLEAGLARCSADGRLRDTMRYYGAHTGRWSHSGLQPGNIPRPAKRFETWGDAEVCAEAERVILGGHCDAETIDLLLRACFIARDGYVFAVQDFSGVEARCLAFRANDYNALRVFESGVSPYKIMAGGIFRVAPDSIGKGDPRYTVGKIAELACFGASTRVLTRRGAQSISELAPSDQLWDGTQWVSHGGVVQKGPRATIEIAGVRVTPSHLIWAGKWFQARSLARGASTLCRALAIATESLPYGSTCLEIEAACAAYARNANAARKVIAILRTCVSGAQRAVRRVQQKLPGVGLNSGGDMRRSCRTTRTAVDSAIVSQLFISAARIRITQGSRTTAAAASRSIRRGSIARSFSRIWLPWITGMILRAIWIAATTTAVTSLAIYDLSLGALIRRTVDRCKHCKVKSISCEPVYDIAYAGPLNRFTVLTDRGAIIVHNCGYGMGAVKFEWTCAKGGVPDLAAVGVDARAVVQSWRKQHAPIVRFWRQVEEAAFSAARGVGASAGPYHFAPSDNGRDVAAFLPSGRPIVYTDVRIGTDDKGRPRLSYLGTKGREHTYGGKLTENLVQAECRDLLAEALVASEAAGLEPVLTVHDEIVAEVPACAEREGATMLHETMITLPEWAEGFPIGAAGHTGKRYRK